MSLKTPINHDFNIKCPKCEHKLSYNLRLDDLEKVSSKEKPEDTETKYKFISYVVCKNPLCHYDIELKGYIFEYPADTINTIELASIK
ncbi:hypothetical protein [Faecalimicrobium dakarense]|uniref:hypothetical protein n=1 Tax=Faecalimicrobium dakarense TaxID=1301100 RepID=UPI0004BA6024|nr:hypothetical protein [[Clostridium] dakarense]